MIIIIICLSGASFTLYVSFYYTKYMGGNLYLNTMFAGVASLFSSLVTIGLKYFVDTKHNLLISCLICIVFFPPILFDLPDWVIAVCFFISFLQISAQLCIIFVLITELFFPLFVPFVFCMADFVGRLLSIMSAQVVEIHDPVPVVCVVVVQVIMVILILFIRNN